MSNKSRLLFFSGGNEYTLPTGPLESRPLLMTSCCERCTGRIVTPEFYAHNILPATTSSGNCCVQSIHWMTMNLSCHTCLPKSTHNSIECLALGRVNGNVSTTINHYGQGRPMSGVTFVCVCVCVKGGGKGKREGWWSRRRRGLLKVKGGGGSPKRNQQSKGWGGMRSIKSLTKVIGEWRTAFAYIWWTVMRKG